jgi:hypothetical protein
MTLETNGKFTVLDTFGANLRLLFKVKVKQYNSKPMEAQGERMYSSYSFTTSALDGGEWSALRPFTFDPF